MWDKLQVTLSKRTLSWRYNNSDGVLILDINVILFVQEYDHPYVLLQNNYSQFTSLVKETGRAMHDQLVKIAKQSYYDKYEET